MRGCAYQKVPSAFTQGNFEDREDPHAGRRARSDNHTERHTIQKTASISRKNTRNIYIHVRLETRLPALRTVLHQSCRVRQNIETSRSKVKSSASIRAMKRALPIRSLLNRSLSILLQKFRHLPLAACGPSPLRTGRLLTFPPSFLP